MATKVFDTKTVLELEPGKTTHRKLSNASPDEAVWSANARPIFDTLPPKGTQVLEEMELEITRLWRKLIVTGTGSNLKTETEIHFVIKNVGKTKARFTVLLSAVS